jgi:hypothetical protein
LCTKLWVINELTNIPFNAYSNRVLSGTLGKRFHAPQSVS